LSGELLYGISLWLIWPALFGLLLLATEAGYRLAVWRRATVEEPAKSQVGTIEGGIFGLLGLLLGFSFVMAVSRFEKRKDLVLEESNAIGTAFLRTQLLSEPQRTETAKLFRRYIDVRLAFHEAGADQEKLHAANAQTERLQDQLWAQAVAAAGTDRRAVTTGLFLQAVNDVIDLHAKRLTAVRDHVPESIILLLIGVGVIAMLVMGQGCGLAGNRHFLVASAVALLTASVLVLIVDLDRPLRGLIQVGQQSMIDLKRSLDKQAPEER